MTRRPLLLLPLLVLLWLGVACNDDGAASPAALASPPAAGSAVAGQVRAQLVIDFSGAPSQRPRVAQALSVAPGTKAWDAIVTAIGQGNVSTQNFGELGLFITGFYGVQAQGNHFWEFRVNGQSSEQGVSVYTVREGDTLEFRYASF